MAARPLLDARRTTECIRDCIDEHRRVGVVRELGDDDAHAVDEVEALGSDGDVRHDFVDRVGDGHGGRRRSMGRRRCGHGSEWALVSAGAARRRIL
jgi:hypothetical protein